MTAATARNLDWRPLSVDGQQIAAEAFGISCFYLIRGTPGDWMLTHPGPTSYGHTPGYKSQVAAKQAAQVDFERRVRASLVDKEDR